ncbi:MAG: type IX secretion system membrane protein PorP/SprF [Saprospiraceae bacterium]
MKHISYILFAVFLLSVVSEITAQDPIYSQFYNAPTLINPAFAGNTKGALVTINYRNQWPAIPNAYSTYSVTYDQRWNKSSGLGLAITTDNAGEGAIKTTKITGIYSYRIKLNRDSYIKGGIEAGYGQSRLDHSKLVFLDNLDPQYGDTSPGGISYPTSEQLSNSPSRSYFDVSSGFLIYTPIFYGGMSFKHMNTPNIDFIDDLTGETGQLPMRWTIHGGAQLSIDGSNNFDDGAFISPNILFVKQQNFWQLNVGAYVNVFQVFGGAWYRHSGITGDAIIASVGVKTGFFKIGYSFDYTVSGLSIGSGGAHEIGIVLNFDRLLPKGIDYNDCLMLFR